MSDEDWAIIEEVARLSPSSFGYEPWKFLIIHNEQIKTDLRPFAWGALNSLDGASHFVIALARKNVKANSTHVKHIVEAVQGRDFSQVSRQQEFFKQFQEHDFNLTTEKDIFQWATKQTYIALGNMLTAAAELGIDSCPIEGFNIAQTEDYLSSQGLINLSDYGVAYMAGFGYSAEERPLKKRQNKHEIFEVIN
ncbi:NAD(P)H-dependent oxidoreductase [Vagococcus penaei]|uniref:NAD(P)H-dependent oxidoreductase n=1 Tax=Vagococcus penaei TaxID=633807 RepID=UPI003001B698